MNSYCFVGIVPASLDFFKHLTFAIAFVLALVFKPKIYKLLSTY